MDFQKYVGIPFKKNGRSLLGVDCFGIVYVIWKDFNLEKPLIAHRNLKRVGAWGKDGQNRIDESIANGVVSEVKLVDLKPLDMVTFNLPGGFFHFGVYVGDDYFIHSRDKVSSARDRLQLRDFWITRFYKAVRVVE